MTVHLGMDLLAGAVVGVVPLCLAGLLMQGLMTLGVCMC